MTEALYLTCPSCRAEFRSGAQIPKESFEGVVVEGDEQECPNCGAKVMPGPDTAFFKDE